MHEPPRFATHNARVETLATKPTFRGAWRARQRLLVPADGYYEWQVTSSGTRPAKQPWYMTGVHGEAQIAFAGLYDWWRPPGAPPDELPLASCTVITSEPGVDVADIHDRQPVVLDRDAWEVWLDPATSPEEARALLVPSRVGTLARRRVGGAVGNSRNEGPELIDEIVTV
jgi:putative SOS response-associated peptidase YedK